MEELFKKLGYMIADMPIGKLIDVSEQNKYLKSFDIKNRITTKSKILGIIRKEDTTEYKVYETKTAEIENIYLFSGSPKHRILVLEEDIYNWYTLEELNIRQKDNLRLHGYLSSCAAITENGLKTIRVEETNNTIPIVDVQMENGCYFSDGILSHNSGGNALKFYASQRLDIRRIGAIKQGDKIVGNRTRVKVAKNKLAPPFRETEFDIKFGIGIDKNAEIIDLGAETNVITKSGSWYSYNDTKIGQGRDNAMVWLSENPNTRDEIRAKIMDLYGLTSLTTTEDQQIPQE
jgi:hypothetical protein